eukprot:TRINITY_DN1467_c0_g1_i2.p1 TRINITY_DN1467_c0_g1~~TRINITY_DN1467_c0_g1_i2.p1  ORF type:complete len:382 (-),score=92.24 TRINITY_DN1467_c0_g1_i2:155-1300(-)
MRVIVVCVAVCLSLLLRVSLGAPVLPHYDVFVRDTLGFECFRVPALYQSSSGTLLALAEARNYTGTRPATCENDVNVPTKWIVLRRSLDGGATWGGIQVIATVPCGGGYECGYQMVLQDTLVGGKDGTVHVFFGGKAGISVVASVDDGVSWQAPKVVEFKVPPHISVFSPSPGHGLQIDAALCSRASTCHPGRLVGPFECHVNTSYAACVGISDDHGETWTISAHAQLESKENEMVQLVANKSANGASLYLNARNYQKPAGVRFIASSVDNGNTLSDFGVDKSLIEPVTSTWTGVVAGLARASLAPSKLIFADDNNATARADMTVKISLDEAHTWSTHVVIDSGLCGYADLVPVKDGVAGIAYERGNTNAYDMITFVPFKV